MTRGKSLMAEPCVAGAVSTLFAVSALSMNTSHSAPAVSGDVVRIAFVTDLSGPYESVDGNAGVEAIRMAIGDEGGQVAGKPVGLIALDHRNDPALAAALARKAIDEHGADVIIGGVNSGTSLAMVDVTRERRKPFLVVGAGSSRHTNEDRSPYTVQWAYNTAALSRVTANGLIEEGHEHWYFLTADYAFVMSSSRTRAQQSDVRTAPWWVQRGIRMRKLSSPAISARR